MKEITSREDLLEHKIFVNLDRLEAKPNLMLSTVFTVRAGNISDSTPRIDNESEFLRRRSYIKPGRIVTATNINIHES